MAVVAFLALTSEAAAVQRAVDLLPAIEAALIEKGAPVGADVRLVAPDLVIPGSATISSVSYNRQSGRFAARAGAVIITGTARVAIGTLVLIEPVPRGQEIFNDNIVFAETSDALPGDVALTAEELVGKEARRNLAAGAPLRRSDVAAQILVKRSSLVTVSYERPGVSVTQSGVAQSAGSKGDVVDIEIASGRIIRAVVTGRDRASVIGARHAGLQ